MKWSDKKDELEKLINEGFSYTKIGELYNTSGANIRRTAIRLGINLPKRRKINPNETFNRGTAKKGICIFCGKEFIKYPSSANQFCSKKCAGEFRHIEKYKEFLQHPENYNRANYNLQNFKDIILKEQNNKCAICGMKPEWNNKRLIFIIDHIDGHASHNYRSNLRMVCPNCDSQLDTYKSKNKCGERHYYRYHKTKME